MSSTLRQRKHMAKDEGLTEALLPEPEDNNGKPSSSKPISHQRSKNNQQLIVHPGPFDLNAFLQQILRWWQRLVEAMSACFGAVLPGLKQQKMSLIQAERLSQLRSRAAVVFHIDDPDHEAALRQLWSHAFPALPCTSLKSPQWKEMGWQGEDPSTDIRGAGMLGLECLLYLAEVHPATFHRLMEKLDGERADWEYPFAVAGLNITFTLLEVLGLRVTRGGAALSAQPAEREGDSDVAPPGTPAGRNFLTLMSTDERAFEELSVATFELLDQVWLQQRAGYMQFNQVMKDVRSKVEAALLTHPHTLEELRSKLL